MALIGLLFLVNLAAHVVGPQSFCPGCVGAYLNYFAPLGAVLGGWVVSAILFRRSENVNEPVRITDHQWIPGLKYSALVLSLTWVLWLLGFRTLISHTSQQPELFQRYSVPYFTFLLFYGGGLLVSLVLLCITLWLVSPAARGITNIQRWPWLLALVLVSSALATPIVLSAISRTEPVFRPVFYVSLLVPPLLAWAIISVYGRGRVTSTLAVALIIIVPLLIGARSSMMARRPPFPGIERAAERLASLTTPDDKIFALSDMHVFLLAERYPYPPLMNSEYSFVISSDTEAVLRFNKWNYTLADRWLDEADVVVLSDTRFQVLPMHYLGYPGSGQDVVDLINGILAQDFILLEDVPGPQDGTLHIYRRCAP